MCGLAGFRRRDGRPADEAIAARMLDRQRHRGPDHRGTWAAGDTAFGLDRLAILDLTPQGDQPYLMPDGSGALAYNGEVYNWRALRDELAREGVAFRSHCDTEVVMHALSRWGPERAVRRLNGMFAFAWRDLRDDTLWLGRDRTGIKPLYVAETAAVVAFASESKSLFAHPDIACRPDVHALVTNVWFERLVPPWTAFEGVQQVVPGTLLRFQGAVLEEITWFDLERDLDVGRMLAAATVPFDQHVARFRALIEESVALHLQSDAPLAVMCSGGLDSSLTTAIAARHQPDLVAYVAEAEGLRESEADKAQRVADHVGVRLRRIPIRIAEFPALWVRAAWHNDDPIFFNQNPLALKVCEAVRDDGVKVLVTGEGSDELFGGYGWQAEAARMWRLREWHRRLLPDIAPLRRLGRWLQWLAPFDLERLGEDPFARRATLDRMPTFAPLVLDAGMRKHRAATLFEKLAPIRPLADRAFLAREFDDVYHHLRVLLNANDKMSMAASVEARVPFLENDIIDFGLHLDRRSKWDRGQSKRVVKAAANGLLPADIIHARKVGFGVPDGMFTGYEGILEGGVIAELFKWGSREREQRARLLKDKQWRAGQLVGMELWAQMHFNGASQEQLTERLQAAREG